MAYIMAKGYEGLIPQRKTSKAYKQKNRKKFRRKKIEVQELIGYFTLYSSSQLISSSHNEIR